MKDHHHHHHPRPFSSVPRATQNPKVFPERPQNLPERPGTTPSVLERPNVSPDRPRASPENPQSDPASSERPRAPQSAPRAHGRTSPKHPQSVPKNNQKNQECRRGSSEKLYCRVSARTRKKSALLNATKRKSILLLGANGPISRQIRLPDPRIGRFGPTFGRCCAPAIICKRGFGRIRALYFHMQGRFQDDFSRG